MGREFLPIFLAEAPPFFLFFGQYGKGRLEGWKKGRLEEGLQGQHLSCARASDSIDGNLRGLSV